MRLTAFSLLMFWSWILVPGPAVGQSADFSPELLQVIESSRARDAYWSVVVRDSSGKILEGYHADKLVRPASNLKMLTSAAILDELGPDFTFNTQMYGLGYQEGRYWRGDIIIRAAGDPSISGTFFNKDKFHVFDRLYSALDSMGISYIDGNLIGNDSYFDAQPYPKGWSWDDLSFYYGVEISALSFNENAVDLDVLADGEVGEKPGIQWFPFDTDYINFINEQVITPQRSEYDEYYRRILGTNTIVLGSKVPRHYREEESLSVPNAPVFFMDTFKKYLEGGGMELNGRIIIDSQPRNWTGKNYTLLAAHESPALSRLLTRVNKKSSNFYTEMLLKTAATEHYGTQGSTDLGITLVKNFAESMRMDTTNIEMTDGSGMSPSTLISAKDLTRLLSGMQSHPYFEGFKNSMAEAGEEGSLQYRFKNSPLLGKIVAKTGYVSGVRALSGYMYAASGKPLVFSVVTNNYTEKTSYIDYLHESILKKIFKKY